MTNFKQTLERMEKARSWRDGCTLQDQEAVLKALRIADRLESGVVEIPDKWPESGWNKNAAAFVDLIQATGGFWCMDMGLKYLNIRIDTRTGHFVILDNERIKNIDTDRVLNAMRKWVDECGFNTRNPRAIQLIKECE